MKKTLSLILILCSFLFVKANVYTVTNTLSGGIGSFYQARLDANSNPGYDTIDFNILPYGKVHVIDVSNTNVIDIFDSVLIDGYTQSSASENTNPIGQPNNAQLKIMLSTTTNALAGITVYASSCTIKGLIFYNFGNTGASQYFDGIRLGTMGNPVYNNKILGCWIGVDSTGYVASSKQNTGILLDDVSANNIIGDGTPAGMNIIAGNAIQGIHMTNATNNIIQGNYIGVGPDGKKVPKYLGSQTQLYGVNIVSTTGGNLFGGTTTNQANVISGNLESGFRITGSTNTDKIWGNIIGLDAQQSLMVDTQKNGVYLDAAAANQVIGGCNVGEGNVISGNKNNGVLLLGNGIPDTYGNNILGNFIGTDWMGTSVLPNKYGVNIDGEFASYMIRDNIIGGSCANVIAYNDSFGIRMYGSSALNNSVLKNKFFGNAVDGIRLLAAANSNIAKPNLSSAIAFKDSLIVSGTASLNSSIELFWSFNGQGKNYIGSGNSDAIGNFQVKIKMPADANASSKVVVSATNASGSTSEFSNEQLVSFYSLTGMIYEDSMLNTIDSGIVLLWKYDTIAAPFDSVVSVNISTGGFYKFSNIVVPGEYLIFAIPDSSTHPDALDTYFGDVSRWFDAQKISIFTTTLNKDIICKAKITSGSNTIQGRVEEGQGFSKKTGKIQGPGDPFNGIDVSLIDKSTGSAVAFTQTDSDTTPGIGGVFEFSNVPVGIDYLIHVDVAGIPIDTNTTYNVATTTNDTIDNILVKTDSNYIYFTSETGILTAIKKVDFDFNVYPNPFGEEAFINYKVEKAQYIQLVLYDILGNKVSTLLAQKHSAGRYVYVINRKNLNIESGNYFIKMISDTKEITRKFIIID